MGQIIARIGITGGPMSGKTTSLEVAKNYIEKKYNYRVITTPETATYIIGANIIPPKIIPGMSEEEIREVIQMLEAFQGGITKMQGFVEEFFDELVKILPGDYVILSDRTRTDGEGYEMMLFGERGIERYIAHLKEQGYTPESALARYLSIIFLESYANIAKFEEKQKTESTIRLENNAKEALKVEEFLLKVYKNYPNVTYIPATENIEDKHELIKAAIDKTLDPLVKKLIR